MVDAPSLSVMMANFNHARFLPEALEAILKQSYRPLEIVVVDDASTDDSLDVLNRIAQDAGRPIRITQNDQNLGLIPNLQRLIAQAQGSHVYIPAADDRILPGFLERSMRLFCEFPSAGVSSTLSGTINESGEPTGIVRTPIVRKQDSYLSPAEVLSALKTHGSWFMGNTTIYRRDALLAVGGFDPALGPYGDFTTMVLALQHGACFVPAPLADWRRMHGTYSQRESSNVEAVMAVLGHAEHLMTTRFRDLFPQDYVDDWRQGMLFGAASSIAAVSHPGAFANAAQLVPITTLPDRAFHAAARAWPGLGRRLVKPYLFAKLRRGHFWNTFRRRLSYTAMGRLGNRVARVK